MTENKWEEYYETTFSQPPHKHLVSTIELLNNANTKVAIDCGCGAGRDTSLLLKSGFEVFAFDQEAAAISYLEKRISDEFREKLRCYTSNFSDFHYPPCDLLNASFCLFFTDKTEFPIIWNKIQACIQPGGYFCGNFMGPEDTWAKNSDNPLNYHYKDEVEELLQNFEIITLAERNELGATASGINKNWHIFTVIAKKR